MPRLLSYILGIVVSIALLFYVSNPVAVGLWTGVATALLIPVIDLLVVNWKYLRLHCWAAIHFRHEVRLSISYLLRIEVDGKYLLVRGNRYPGQFQPVGGVYKFRSSIRDQFQRWGVKNDSLIPIDDVSTDDLRIRLPAKNLVNFVRWFESGRNRETGVWREFYEELIATENVRIDDFWNLSSELLRTRINPIRFSRQADSYELLIANIYRVELTDNQKQVLRRLASHEGKTAVGLFSQDQIRRGGAEEGRPDRFSIPPTAEWTL